MAAEDVAAPVEVAAPAPALGEPMDIMTALQLVLRKSLAHGGLVRGLHGAAKVIEKHAAQLCVLAEDCDQPDYIKLVKALCADHNVSLVTVPSAKTLGEWAGLCKIDSEGKARKVVGCSCLVVKAGRLENVVGWYHSHPGYGCWLSGIDVSTQMLNQQYQEPFLAVVIDPTRTMSAGKVEIGAFRTYPDGYKPSDEPVSEY